MVTALTKNSYYNVIKSDGTVLIQNIQYSGREEVNTFIFIVSMTEEDGTNVPIEIKLSKNAGYDFILV